MSFSYDLYLNSGTAGGSHYTNGSNVSLIEITNSDQDYYQTGIVDVYNVPSTQSIGHNALIKINGTVQFNGFINRRKQSIDAGIKHTTYSLIGKTYDLWRYVTDSSVEYSGTTCYIASSLVSSFCPGISGGGIYNNSGTNLTSKMDFSNKVIGECLIELTNIDGFKFYVDDSSNLQYYEPRVNASNFTINESNILFMNPIEISDDGIVNDCLVIGGTEYSEKTEVSTNHPSSTLIPSGIYVAQQFTAEEDTLSAIQLYLNRSIDPNQPETLNFEIWEDTSTYLVDDDFDNTNYLDDSSGVQVYDSHLLLNSHYDKQYYTSCPWVYCGILNSNYAYAGRFRAPSSATIHSLRMSWYNSSSDPIDVWYQIRPTGSDGKPDTTVLCSGQVTVPGNISRGHRTLYLTSLNQELYIEKDKRYAFVLVPDDQNARPYHTASSPWTVFSNGFDPGAPEEGAYAYQEVEGGNWTTWQNGGVYEHTLFMSVYIREYYGFGSGTSIKKTNDVKYIKATLSGATSSNSIKISGTNDNGATWSGLTDGVWMEFGTESNAGTYVKYIFSSNGKWSPKLDSILVEIADSSQGGYPLSGSKIEWSDDISWNANSIPYPPSWSSWTSYSDGKLKPPNWKNSKYWMVLYCDSSNSKYWEYHYDPNSSFDGKLAYSWDLGVNWSSNSDDSEHVPEGNMSFKLGWSQGEITARASNQTSIDGFGRHFKKITDSTANTLELATARAEREVNGSDSLINEGTLIIEGRTDISTNYRFSANLTNYDIDDVFDVVSYTQRITPQQGFVTEINFGKQPYDIARDVESLKGKVYGS